MAEDSYVVVSRKTRCRVQGPGARKSFYGTRSLAQAAAKRLSSTSSDPQHGELEVMTMREYQAQVPMVEVTNRMTGKKVMERADTPYHCSVASEAYWSN